MERATDALDAAAQEVADLVAGRLEEIAEDGLERLFEDPEYGDWFCAVGRDRMRVLTLSDLGREVRALQDGFALPVSCPDEVAGSARAAAAFGTPLSLVLHCYRSGTAMLSRAWREAAEELGLSDEARRELVERGTAFMFEYADRCSRWAEAVYTEERERQLRGREQRLTQMVRDVLAGADLATEELGYPLGADHVAAVAWGPDPDGALDALSADLARRTLRVASDQSTSWGWIAAGRGFGEDELRALRRVVPPEGTRLAIGGPLAGIEGFRRAHDEARQAQRVASRRPGPVTFYEDVGLVALAAQDEARARGFVARELGPLSGDDERSATLRATLSAYLQTGLQASSAASLLGVHERTVANRLRAAEERLGAPVAARAAELETALRLHELLVGR